MNKLYKLFLALIIFTVLFTAVLYFFYRDSESNEACHGTVSSIKQYSSDGRIIGDRNSKARLRKRTITEKKRINILLLGIESKARTDTIMFISYDRAGSKLSIISIPRDTYFYETGYNGGDQRKINAVFGREGEKGCVDAVSKVLCDTPVDYYVSIDYEGVERIIDTIGGVELEVPIDMEAGGIKITKGKQILHGREALQYLRFRKKYKDGDLGRIKAQQKLIKSALSNIQYVDLPKIIGKSFSSIRTNMPVKYLIEYARQFKNDEVKEVSTYMLPGVPMYKCIGGYNWSYFFHSSQKVSELINKIYGIESMEQKKRKHYEFY